jgi:hypothetical protein
LLSGAICYCDLFWPIQRVGVEYDSDTYHTGSDRIADDSERRTALLVVAVPTVTVTRRQITSAVGMHEVAKALDKLLGRRLRPPMPEFLRQRAALRAALLPSRPRDC